MAEINIREAVIAAMVPHCSRCGAEITTGLMAVFCPRAAECEFWPDDEDGKRFILELRGDPQHGDDHARHE